MGGVGHGIAAGGKDSIASVSAASRPTGGGPWPHVSGSMKDLKLRRASTGWRDTFLDTEENG